MRLLVVFLVACTATPSGNGRNDMMSEAPSGPVAPEIIFNTRMFETAFETPLTFAAEVTPGVTVVIDTPPAHGTVTASVQGRVLTIVYTPSAGYSGLDTFTLHVTDGALSSPLETINITVTANMTLTTLPAVSSTCDSAGGSVSVALSGAGAFSRDGGTCPSTVTVGASGVVSGECPMLGSDCTIVFAANGATGVLTLAANAVFVAAGVSAGDGTSWAQAFAQLSDGIAAASGRNVFVANAPSGAPTYGMPVITQSHVHLYAGFTGTERVFSERGAMPAQPTLLTSPNDTLQLVGLTDTLINGVVFSYALHGAVRVIGGDARFQWVGFDRNQTSSDAPQPALGGAVLVSGATATFADCYFSKSVATGGAGASGVTGADAAGAGIAAVNATVTLQRTAFAYANAVGGLNDGVGAGGHAFGAALYASNATVHCVETAFHLCESDGGYGGQDPANTSHGARGGDGHGGAIYALQSTLSFDRCRFYDNQAWGGYGGAGQPGITGGTGGDSGRTGNANGGALELRQSSATFNDTVFNQNLVGANATPGAQGGAAPAGGTGGKGGRGGDLGTLSGGALAIWDAPVTTSFTNVVFYGNHAYAGNSGSGGSGGPSGASGNADGPGGDGGTSAYITGAIIAGNTAISFDAITAYDNINNISLGGPGGLGAPNGNTGVTQPPGSFAVDVFAPVTARNAIFTTNQVAMASALTLTGSCSDRGESGAVAATGAPTLVAAGGELFFPAGNNCVDIGVGGVTGFTGRTNIATLTLDTPPVDAGAHFVATDLISVTHLLSGNLQYTVFSPATDCVFAAPESTPAFGTIAASGSVDTQLAQDVLGYVLLRCGGAWELIQEP